MTDAERKLWTALRHADLDGTHFRRQATIGPCIVDFACHTSRLVFELDGGQHAEGWQAERDAGRDRFLSERGYRVLRFWNSDVMQNMAGVLSVIASTAASRSAPPTPDPSPPLRGGRGDGSLGE